jgi:type I restriction enzyme, S subunit
MANRWSTGRWADLAVLEYGRALRGYQEAAAGDARVYGTNGPIGWTSGAMGSGPTVVVGRKGAYRGVHYAPQPFWVIDTAYWLRPLGPMNIRWAYYQLLTQDINGRDSASAIPSLSRSDFYSFRVQVPPLPEQDAIAEVLGALDDKIGANVRLVPLLRNLAKALLLRAADPARSFVVGEVADVRKACRTQAWGSPTRGCRW